MIKVYTDGSYKSSTDQGGYGVVITENDSIQKILYYGYKNTTNNRMELLAVLTALQYFTTSTTFEIYSDSSYIVSSINNEYLNKWIIDNDQLKLNMDLWKQIYNLLQFHNVKFIWVKGHADNEFNNLADFYANVASIVLNPIIDENSGKKSRQSLVSMY